MLMEGKQDVVPICVGHGNVGRLDSRVTDWNTLYELSLVRVIESNLLDMARTFYKESIIGRGE